MRRRIVLLIAAATLTPALAAGSAQAASFTAHLKAPNHTPKAGAKDWRITVTARSKSGKPLHATALYHFVYGGQVVSTQYPNPGHPVGGKKPYAFTGRYSDTILWPPRAGGVSLTFRVVVTVAGQGSINLDWAVRVRR
jgi:hypothetical protein